MLWVVGPYTARFVWRFHGLVCESIGEVRAIVIRVIALEVLRVVLRVILAMAMAMGVTATNTNGGQYWRQ